MAKQKHHSSFKSQAEEHYREEALEIAKSIQAPAQTKEQTKLIAKGIAKGIAQYKKQEKTKSRARDKHKRKSQSPAANTVIAQFDNTPTIVTPDKNCNSTVFRTLLLSTIIFVTAGTLHLTRYFLQTKILIGTFDFPVFWSLPAGLLLFCFGLWQCYLLSMCKK